VVLALLGLAAHLACTDAPPAGAPANPAKRVSFSILEDYDKGTDLADVARDFALFKELGITTWRGSFGWDDYEPAPGKYDFEWLHTFAALAAEHGITLRPYIGYTPQWAASGGTDADAWNDPPRDLEAWSRFVRTLAGEMKRHRHLLSYEIYNEENVKQWWDGTPAAYRDVLVRGLEAIRAAGADVQVLFGGMVFADEEWVDETCAPRGAAAFDILPFHAYPETWTPPGVVVENYLGAEFGAGFAEAADEACGAKPLWINETGFATVEGKSERDQAEWWARAIPTFLSEPRIEHIGVYEIKDLRADSPAIGGAPNYHLGITRVDRTKKLAFHTVQRLVQLLDAGTLTIADERLSLKLSQGSESDIRRHLFLRPDGRSVLFAWSMREEAVADVMLPAGGSRATEYALDGTARPVTSFDGRRLENVRLRPGEARVFSIDP
jgi:hypothetical protein